MKGRPTEKKSKTVTVYKKQTGKKYYMLVTEEGIDEILSTRKRKPLLPNNCELIEVGIGESFINNWKKQYNIKNETVV